MTAYQRLESMGLWHAAPGAPRRDVLVSFGKATLIVSDHDETALTHWSLAAVRRLNPGEHPALYSPGDEAFETLVIDDPLMIDAIEQVRRAIRRRRPRSNRLGLFFIFSFVLTITLFAAFILPDAVLRHTLSVVPAVKRASIGQELLTHVERHAGRVCDNPYGQAALAKLQLRLDLERSSRLLVMPGPMREALTLPGRFVLLNRSLVEDFEGADAMAGYVLFEIAAADASDPLERMLGNLGLISTLRLLTTGRVSDRDLAEYAKTVLSAARSKVNDAELLRAFETAKVSSGPYARSLNVPEGETLGLIGGDPYRDTPTPVLLPDADWVALQSVCVNRSAKSRGGEPGKFQLPHRP
ncbi:MAG: hypothetical protein AAF982_07825 [Pseudomonadota bacterium]